MTLLRKIAVSLLLIAFIGGCKSSTTGPDGGDIPPRKGSIQISGDEVELKGFIEAIGPGQQLTVFGYSVLVDDSTQIESEGGQHIGFDDLIIGMFLEVHGTIQPDETILAVEIEVETRDDDI